MNNKTLFPIPKYKLCYISGNKAFFTTQALSKQSGDDWDDVPYEHNAGSPSEWHREFDKDTKEWSIAALYFDVPWGKTPCYEHCNSPYSVDMINKKVVPWLIIDSMSDETKCYAGMKYLDFVDAIISHNGKVYADVHQRFHNR
jgi:hypothetical protein